MVLLGKSTKFALIFVGIGVAAGIGVSLALGRNSDDIYQRIAEDPDGNPWLDPAFLSSQQQKLRIGSYYKSTLAVGEEGFFISDAKGGQGPYRFEWSYSDGVSLTGQNVTRSFDDPGKYGAQLSVTDASGKNTKQSISFEVVPAA